MIKRLFKIAVLKCNDVEFLKLITLTPKKTEMFLTKKISTVPFNLEDSKLEFFELYNKFLAYDIVDDSKALLLALKPLLSENHPLVKQLQKFVQTEDFDYLYDIAIAKEKYLTNITNLSKVSTCLTSFANKQINKIDVKYLKAFAATVIDNA